MNVCDKLFFGEMVTTGPSTGIMSLPRGVRTSSIGNLLILFSGAPTCVWRHLTTTFPHPYSTPTVFVVILCIFLELTPHLFKPSLCSRIRSETQKTIAKCAVGTIL